MRNSLHILLLCLVCLFVAGCDKSATDSPAPEKEIWVNLNIGVALPDAAGTMRSTRADGDASHESSAAEAERMQTLRIVVVDKDGNVEANRFLYAGAVDKYGEEHFRVRANETKQVYVFVNETNARVNVYKVDGAVEAIPDFHKYLGDIAVGKPFPREEIAGLEVRLNGGVGDELDAVGDGHEKALGGLPMSKCEEVEVKNVDLSHIVYLHRAAVKFTFNITNKSSLARELTGLSIDKMSRREYYLPRVTEYDTPDGRPVGGKLDIVGFDAPNVGANDYYTFEKSFSEGVALPARSESAVTLPAIYLLEGGFVPEIPLEGKNYSMTISLNGVKTQPKVFDNLDRLPRNTHVVVNITVNNQDVDWTVDLRPYGEVILNPDFGLDRD